jgi:broad specificity phosphatase PhoE
VSTTLFLVRHAAHNNVGGFLAGRIDGVRLGAAGLAQAERLAERMRRETFAAVHSSPRDRTLQTAEAIAAASGINTVHVEEALDEINLGDWSGKSFDELNTQPLWQRWNSTRSLTRAPGGETMLEVQSRVMTLIERLAQSYRDSALVLVSHADVIGTAVCFYLGLSLDAWSRFEIGPASITTIVAGDWGAKVLGLNEVVS